MKFQIDYRKTINNPPITFPPITFPPILSPEIVWGKGSGLDKQLKGWYNMGMINSNAVYVVFTPNPVFEGIAGTMLVQYTPSGYHLAPYPMANDEIKFTGSYLECDFILHALLDYNPN